MQDRSEDAVNPSGDGDRKKEQIARQVSGIELRLDPADIEIPVQGATRIPLDQLPALGVAFASMPQAFRTVVGSASIPRALVATDKFGNPIDPSMLQRFNDGSGIMGSQKDAVRGFAQARFHEIGGDASKIAATVPYDPTMLLVAAVMMQVNAKLDDIKELQEEMFEYLRQKDKAELRGDLQTLVDVLEGYRYNWNNEIWCKNSHMKVLDIKQEAEKAGTHLRAQISSGLQKRGLVESRLDVGKRLDRTFERLREYQLAVYIYSFASFLEPMLSANFDSSNLRFAASGIETHLTRYREIYTKCYDAIEGGAKGAIDAAVLGGVSFAAKAFGDTVAATPIGEHTLVDEALIGAGKDVGTFNEKQTDGLLEKLRGAKAPDVLPFKEGVENMDAIANRPVRILADAQNIYLLPQGAD